MMKRFAVPLRPPHGTRRSATLVRCDNGSGNSERVHEVRKQLVDLRRTYEDKRLASFNSVLVAIAALAQGEKDFVKQVLEKVVPQCDHLKKPTQESQKEEDHFGER